MNWAYLKYVSLIFVVSLLACLWVPIPSLEMDYSKILLDKEGQLLAARIAKDEQWRFPIEEEIPEGLKQAIIYFEDQYFDWHFGFNPVSMIKAAAKNFKAKKVVRGGSTLTMQLMRMYRGNQSRTYDQKLIEIMGALKLELLYSKEEILKMWASSAPFGGNTVGASSAAHRYYNRPLSELSTAEYATLAVLPNAPSSVHMSRNVEKLTAKRNSLLKKLWDNNKISKTDYGLAIQEDIYFLDLDLPTHGLHLLDHLIKKHSEQYIFQSTVDRSVQNMAADILQSYSDLYQHDGIENGAVVIIDCESNELVAYVGNTNNKEDKSVRYVDCANAPRSYGSLLKTFLYARAIDQGALLPHELIKDIPTNINGFTPQNFDKKYRGSVPMDMMISHSLNVPAVRVMNYTGGEEFHHMLREQMNFRFLNPKYDHHGLSLILGGGEASLLELSTAYKGLIQNYLGVDYPYGPVKITDLPIDENTDFSFHIASVHHTIQAMKSVNRPREEQNYLKMLGSEIAWKTGTSYGHKDAWSIGSNGKYVLGIWIGNEDGRGVYNLTGGLKAAPILFKIMRQLESGTNFPNISPIANTLEVCVESGRLKGKLCNETKLQDVPIISHRLRACDHHRIIREQQSSNDTLFALSPTEEYFKDKYYGVNPGLSASKNLSDLSIVYPKNDAIISIPKKLNGEYAQLEMIANKLDKASPLFWFVDDEYLTRTDYPHEVSATLQTGYHTVQINDESGNEEIVNFTVEDPSSN